MTDLEPVRTGAVVPRGAGAVVPPERWPAAGLSRGRTIVTSGVRALGRGALLSVPALAATAAVAARAAGLAARLARWSGAPAGPEVVGRVPGAPAPDATLEISWVHVEMHWRS